MTFHDISNHLSRNWLVCILVGFVSLNGYAESKVEKSVDPNSYGLKTLVTLSLLIETAHKKNPLIEASKNAWKKEVESYRIETAYPDPKLMVTYFTDPIETRLGPQKLNALISQPIPFPGKLTKKGDIIEEKANIAKVKLDKTVRTVVYNIHESFFELFYIRTAKKIAENTIKRVAQIRALTETAHAKDKSLFIDMVKAQSQLGQLHYDLILLSDLEKVEITRLNGLLNRAPDAPIENLIPPPIRKMPFTPEALFEMADANADDIKMATHKVNMAKSALTMARLGYLPNFSVGLFYAQIDDPDVAKPPEDAGKDAWGIQGGVTIPLWLGKNFGRSGKAKAEINEAKALLTSKRNTLRTNIRRVYAKLINSHRLIELYRDNLLPQTIKAVETSETFLSNESATLNDVLETQSTLYNFELTLERAKADYGKTLASLERLIGKILMDEIKEEEEEPS